jgi:hypothetical protein
MADSYVDVYVDSASSSPSYLPPHVRKAGAWVDSARQARSSGAWVAVTRQVRAGGAWTQVGAPQPITPPPPQPPPPTPTPAITSLTPSSGATTGFTVTVVGTGLIAGTTVTCGGQTVTPVIAGPTQLTFAAPPVSTATSVTVTVTNSNGTSNIATLAYNATPPAAFTLGTTMPTAANTGLNVNNPNRTGMTTITTSSATTIYHVTTAGQVFNNVIFNCFVDYSVNCTFNNCVFMGGNTSTFVQYGTVSGRNGSASAIATFNYCAFKPQVPRYYLNAVTGGNMKLWRCDLSYGTDAVGWDRGNGTIQGSYCHDMVVWSGVNPSTGLVDTNFSEHPTDSRFPGVTHNDCIEFQGGDTYLVEGNNFRAYTAPDAGNPDCMIPWTNPSGGGPTGTGNGNTYPKRNYCNALTVAATNGTITNLVVKNNWLDGGEILFQQPAAGRGHDSGSTTALTGNRWGCDQHPYSGTSYQQIRFTPGIATITGLSPQTNTYLNEASVPVALRGQLLNPPGGSSTQTTYQVSF